MFLTLPSGTLWGSTLLSVLAVVGRLSPSCCKVMLTGPGPSILGLPPLGLRDPLAGLTCGHDQDRQMQW